MLRLWGRELRRIDDKHRRVGGEEQEVLHQRRVDTRHLLLDGLRQRYAIVAWGERVFHSKRNT